MPQNIEDLLRQSLESRAQDVSPDPKTWDRVQQRIRRGRLVRWSAAGGLAVATLALLALVLPSLNGQRVEFEPAPVATQPPAEEVPEPRTGGMPEVGGMVFTDGQRVYSMALDGESADELYRANFDLDCPSDERCVAITDVAVRPGSTLQSLGALVRTVDGCGSVEWVTRVPDNGGWLASQATVEAAACPTSMAFSPDGGHAGWVLGGETGAWSLETVDWLDDGPGKDDAGLGLPFDWASDVVVEDWVWKEVTGETSRGGYLYLSADDGATFRVFRQPIERQSDGAIALPPGDPEPLPPDGDWLAAAYTQQVFRGADSDSPQPAPAAYTIDAQWVDGTVDAGRISRRARPDDAVMATLDLPAELFAEGSFDIADFWIDTLGNTVAYGNGAGGAWVTTWDGDGFTAPRKVAADIVSADLLAPAADETEEPAEPDGEAASTDSESTVEVQVHFTQKGGECGEDLAAYPRTVQGPAVLRGALEQLLAGPTAEEIAAGASSVFPKEAAGALNSVSIADNGVARVDFDDFSDRIWSTSCIRGALFSQLEPTIRQFPTVKEVVYSFDGSIEAFYTAYELVIPPHRPDIPLEVTRMQQRIVDALVEVRQDRDYDALAALINRETFSCSFSDQNEDCIALWRQQEADGQDPLGPLFELLTHEQPAKVEGAPIWAWPAAFVQGDEYLGPRTGIDEDGVWRYYQQGGD